MGTYTPYMNLYKPANGEVGWGDEVDTNFDLIDGMQDPALRPNVLYAAPWGDDDNDGRTWRSAKASLYGAMDENGGTGIIRFADNAAVNPDDATKGLWLCDATPPNSDWRQITGSLHIEGCDMTTGTSASWSGPFPVGGAATLGINNETDSAKPAIWIGPGSQRVSFAHISTPYHAAPLYIGPGALFAHGSNGRVNYTFEYCAFAMGDTRDVSSVQMRGFCFWGFFRNCAFQGNYDDADPDTDGHVAVLMDAAQDDERDSYPSYLQYFDNCFFAGGGIKDKAGGGDLHVTNCVSENMGGPGAPENAPDVWIQRARGNTGTVIVDNFSHYDSNIVSGLTSMVLELHPTDGDRWDANKMLVIGGWQVQAQGAMTQIVGSGPPNRYWNSEHSWAIDGQIGVSEGERLHGRHPGGQWQFGPRTAIGDNLCMAPASYNITDSYAPTMTNGVRAPDGQMLATRLEPEGHNSCFCYFTPTFNPAGDYVFYGYWLRIAEEPASADDSPGKTAVFGSVTVLAGSTSFKTPPWVIGEWRYVGGWFRGSAAGGCYFGVQVWPTTIEVAYPMLVRVPDTDLTDIDAAEMARHLGTSAYYLPSGAAGTEVGQKFIAHGGIGVGNSVSATTPGSVVKKIQVFDEAGASLGYIPVYSAIT